MLYEEITASSLIKIDLDGNTVLQPEHDYSVNAAGYVIHSAVHTARHDAECVIHTHTRAGTAVSALADGLMPLSQTAMRFAGHLAYHDYEGPAFNRGERERLVADLGNKNAMILRNHGLLVCAPSIPQAFNLIYWLEQACKIQIDILSCGRALHVPAHDVVTGTADALSGTEITLNNESQHQSARQGLARRRGRPAMVCWNGRRCDAGSIAWMLPMRIDPAGRRTSVDRHAAVNREDLSSGDLGLIRCQINRHVGHVDRLPHAEEVAGGQLARRSCCRRAAASRVR